MAYLIRYRKINVPPKKFSAKGKNHYLVKLWIRATDTDSLDSIKSVIYHLHSSFKDPERKVIKRERRFELKIRTYGFFSMKATLELKNGSSSVIAGRVQW